jgi:hypothetical protein
LPWQKSVELVPGETVDLAVPELAPDPSVVTPSAHRGSTQRTVGFITGGVGLAGLVLGTAFGILAVADHNTANGVCPSAKCTTANSPGFSDWQDAVTAGNVSTVAFVAGGVALAAGVTLFLIAPKEAGREAASLAIRPGVAPGAGSLLLLGTW